MWNKLTPVALAAGLLVASGGIAHAQGSITQDPGRLAPRNLTLQYLGPSVPGPTAPGAGNLGAGDLPDGNWSGRSATPAGTSNTSRARAPSTGTPGYGGGR